MNEDDTFERLKRLPFEQMAQIVAKFNCDSNGTRRPELYQIMKDQGWSEEEYTKAHQKYYEYENGKWKLKM